MLFNKKITIQTFQLTLKSCVSYSHNTMAECVINVTSASCESSTHNSSQKPQIMIMLTAENKG